MDDTASLISDHDARRAQPPAWYAVLALDAARPLAGAERIALAAVDELAVGRGPARALTRDRARLRLDLDDRFQSKDHFRLRRDGDGWRLEDLGSKNGTRCRGARVAAPIALADGDVIEAGAAFFVVRRTTAPVDDRALAPASDGTLHTLHAELGAELELLARLAPSRLPILLHGESGSGKEVAARTIHALSRRRGPLVAVNCGALPAALAEAELFGARRGAFSGAVDDRAGLIRTADHGTLFLDEIADLPLPAQAALLRFVQEGEVRPLGAPHTLKVDVRIIAATHRDLEALVARDAFRHDLAARLRGHVLALPPLRDRLEDLGLVCSELLLRLTDGTRPVPHLSRAAARALFAHAWPGNVRELEHALRYALARASTELTDADLPALVSPPAAPSAPRDEPDQRAHLVALLAEHGGNLSAVARALETSRSQVRRLLDRYGLEAKP